MLTDLLRPLTRYSNLLVPSYNLEKKLAKEIQTHHQL